MDHGKFLKNAAVISLGAVVAKGIGVLYRIPLTAALGGYGMGLYQMAYPLFVVLLTFSSTGIPSVIARTVAEDRARGMGSGSVRGALRLFALLGGFATLLMCLLAPFMSALQGDRSLVPCYLALAPSVFLVTILAVLRGYFQGRGEMAPTALSEIVEQLIKTAFGLYLAGKCTSPADGAAAALFAVTLSEAAATLWLFFRYRNERRTLLRRERSGGYILFSALPVMAAAGLLPISRMADSVLIVRLLARYTPRAVTLYGLLAGAAATLSSLPATLCYGLVAAIVPSVARSFARGEREEGRRRALYALLVTIALSLPLAASIILFARPIVELLFPRLAGTDGETLITLVRLSCLSSVFLAGIDTLTAALTGMNRAKKAARSMLIAVGVKTAFEIVLINGRLHIFGAAIAASACYTVAFFLDLFYTVKKDKEKAHDHGDRIGHSPERGDMGGIGSGKRRGRGARAYGDARAGDVDRGGYPL